MSNAKKLWIAIERRGGGKKESLTIPVAYDDRLDVGNPVFVETAHANPIRNDLA